MFTEVFQRFFRNRVAALAIGWIAVMGVSGPPPEEAAAAAVETPSYADLAEQVQHAVVNISTVRTIERGGGQGMGAPESPLDDFFNRFFGGTPQPQRRANALGSGVLIDGDGLILTNNHVVAQADTIQVVLENQQEFEAEVVGRDPKTDLALIRIVSNGQNLPKPVKLGDSDKMRVGESVMAVGNPFGLGSTVTVGIISAKGRVIGAGPYDDFLQTDAAINPGNSGGPLFNMKGEVIGINTAIVATGQGIGFAIPVNLAKDLLPQLKTGSVTRGWIGVVIQDLTGELAESFDLQTTEGVLVADVMEGSPADEAGLTRGDVIVSMEGEKIKDAHELSRMAARKKPGTRLDIGILRNGDRQSVSLKIGTMPDDTAQAQTPSRGGEPDSGTGAWGLSVQPLTPELSQRLGLQGNEGGMIVTGVEPQSPAAEAGMRPGDLIKEINRKKVENREELTSAIQQAKKEENMLVLAKRSGNTFYVVLEKE